VRIERVIRKVAIIKQQIESMCISEIYFKKCKNRRQETICSQMLIFLSKMPLNSPTSIYRKNKFFRLAIAHHERERRTLTMFATN
jgi:hypothetical protein